ncbi:unnamed protein product [Ectocarpus sp. 6 AP-2014]
MDGDPRDGAVPVDSGSNGLAAGTVAGASPRPDRSEPGSASPAGFAGLSTDPSVGGSKQHLGLAVVAQQETEDDEPGDVDGSGNGTQHRNAELAAAAAAAAAMPLDWKPPPVPAGSRHPQPPSADGERSTGDGTPAATDGSPAGVAGLPTSHGAPPPTAPPLPATPASSSKSGGAMKLGGGASMGPNISSAPRGMGGRHRHPEGGHGDAAAATAGTPASSSATQGPADDFGDILAGGHGPTPTEVASMEAVTEDGPDAGVSMASVARQTSPSPSSMEVDSLLAFPRGYGTPSPLPPAARVPPVAGRPSETAVEAEEEMLSPRQPPTAGGALSASRDEPGAWTGEEGGGGAACPRDRALLPQLPTGAPPACSESDREPQESGGSKESLTPPQGVRASAEPIAARSSSPLHPPGPGGATGKVLNDFASPVAPVAAEQGGAAIGDRPTGRASVATPQGWLERDAAKDATPRVGAGAAGSDRTRSEAMDAVKSVGPPSLADSPVRRAGKGQEDEAVESRNNVVVQGAAAAGSEPLLPPPQLAPSSAEARSLSPGEVTTPRATLDPVEGGVDARLGVEHAPSRGGGGVQAMDVDGPQQQQQQQQPSSAGMSGQQDRGFRSLDGEVYTGAFGSRASEGSAGGGDGGAGDEATDGAAGRVAGDVPGGSRPGQGRDPPGRSTEEKEGAGERSVRDVPRGVAGRRGRDAQPLSGLAPGVVLPALEGRASSEAAPAQTSSSSPAIPTPFEGNSVGMLAAGAANPCDFSGQSLADQLLADDPPEMMVVGEGFPAGERTALVGGGAPGASGGEAAVNAGGVSALGRRTNGDEALAGPRRSSTAAEPAGTAAEPAGTAALDRQRVGLKVGGGGEQPGWAARAAGASSSGGGGGAAPVGGFVPRGKTTTATASESVLNHGRRTAAAPFDSSSSSRPADDATTTTAQCFLPPENDTYAALLGLRTPSSTSALAPLPPQPTTPASAPSPAFSTSSTAVIDMFGSRMSAQAVSGVGGGGGGGDSAAGSTAALRGRLPIGRPELRHPSLQQQQLQQLQQQQELRRRQQAAAAAEVGEFSSSFEAPAAAAAASVSGRRMSDVGARGFGGPSQAAVPRGAVSGRRPVQAAEETWRATGLTLPPATSTVTAAGGGDGSAHDRERRLSGVSGESCGVHAMVSAPLSSFGASPLAPQEAGARGEGGRNGRGLSLQAVAQGPTASSSGAGLSPRFGGGAIGVNHFSDAPVANTSYNSAQSFGGSGSTSPRGGAGLHAAGAGAGAAASSSSAITPFPSASAPASSSSSSLANGGPMHRAVAAAGNSFATHTSRTLPPPLSMTPGVSAGSSPRQAPAGWRSGPPGGTSNDARVQQNSWLSNDGANGGGGGGGISPRGFGQQPVARGSHHQLQPHSAGFPPPAAVAARVGASVPTAEVTRIPSMPAFPAPERWTRPVCLPPTPPPSPPPEPEIPPPAPPVAAPPELDGGDGQAQEAAPAASGDSSSGPGAAACTGADDMDVEEEEARRDGTEGSGDSRKQSSSSDTAEVDRSGGGGGASEKEGKAAKERLQGEDDGRDHGVQEEKGGEREESDEAARRKAQGEKELAEKEAASKAEAGAKRKARAAAAAAAEAAEAAAEKRARRLRVSLVLKRLREDAEERKRSGRLAQPRGGGAGAGAGAAAALDDPAWAADEDPFQEQEPVIAVPRLRGHEGKKAKARQDAGRSGEGAGGGPAEKGAGASGCPPLGQRRLQRRLGCARRHAALAQHPGGAGLRLSTLLKADAPAEDPSRGGCAGGSSWLGARLARMRRVEGEEWAAWQRRVGEEEASNPGEAAGPPLPFGFVPRLVHRALGAYALIRTFSRPFRLTPASSVSFLRALSLRLRTPLLDAIHCELLRRVLCLLRGRAGNWAKSSAAQRELDWKYLDQVTWPAYFVEFVQTMEEQRQREDAKAAAEAAAADAEQNGMMSVSEGEEEEDASLSGDSDGSSGKRRRRRRRRGGGNGGGSSSEEEEEEEEEEMDSLETLCLAFQAGEHHLLPLEMKVQALEYLVDRAMECPWFEKEIDNRVRTPPEAFVVDADDGKVFDCVICGQVGNLLCCDNCPRAYHPRCVGGKQGIDSVNWSCWECLIEDSARDGVRVPRVSTSMGPVWVIGGYVFRPTPPPPPPSSRKKDGAGGGGGGGKSWEAAAEEAEEAEAAAIVKAAEQGGSNGNGSPEDRPGEAGSQDEDGVSEPSSPSATTTRRAPAAGGDEGSGSEGKDSDSDGDGPSTARQVRVTRSRLKATTGEPEASATTKPSSSSSSSSSASSSGSEDSESEASEAEKYAAKKASSRKAPARVSRSRGSPPPKPAPSDVDEQGVEDAAVVASANKKSRASKGRASAAGRSGSDDDDDEAGGEAAEEESPAGGGARDPGEEASQEAEAYARAAAERKAKAEARTKAAAEAKAAKEAEARRKREARQAAERAAAEAAAEAKAKARALLIASSNPLEYVNRYAKAVPCPGMPAHKEAAPPLELSQESHFWHAWPLGAVGVPHPLLPGDPVANPAEGEGLVACAHLEPVARLLLQLEKSFGGLLFGTQWTSAWGLGGQWPMEVRAAGSVQALGRLAQELVEALPARVFRESWQTPYELKVSRAYKTEVEAAKAAKAAREAAAEAQARRVAAAAARELANRQLAAEREEAAAVKAAAAAAAAEARAREEGGAADRNQTDTTGAQAGTWMANGVTFDDPSPPGSSIPGRRGSGSGLPPQPGAEPSPTAAEAAPGGSSGAPPADTDSAEYRSPKKQRRRSSRPSVPPVELVVSPASMSPLRSSRGKRKASMGGGRESFGVGAGGAGAGGGEDGDEDAVVPGDASMKSGLDHSKMSDAEFDRMLADMEADRGSERGGGSGSKPAAQPHSFPPQGWASGRRSSAAGGSSRRRAGSSRRPAWPARWPGAAPTAPSRGSATCPPRAPRARPSTAPRFPCRRSGTRASHGAGAPPSSRFTSGVFRW